MASPYRTRLEPRLNYTSFFRLLERRRAARRRRLWLVPALVFAPALAVASTGLLAAAAVPVDEEMGREAKAAPAAVGLTITPHGSRDWAKPLPANVPAIPADSALSAELLQATLKREVGSKLSRCYATALGTAKVDGYEPFGGQLVVSLAVKRNGRPVLGLGGTKALMRMGVADCVYDALGVLQFPELRESVYVHFPIGFEP